MSDSREKDGQSASRRDYSDDRPVHTEAEDRFGRYLFAKTLADMLASHSDQECLVIGLYGAWGSGKTSVMNFVREELGRRGDVIVFSFNPWRYPTEEQLLKQFYDQFGKALRRSVTRWHERAAGRISRLLSPSADAVEAGSASAGKVARALSKLATDHSQVVVDTARKRVREFLTGTTHRVVVLLDDLDRLESDEAHAVLRLVKLNADFPRTTYVLAADFRMLTSTLTHRFTGGVDSGRSFLEKIVQVPLHLPPCDPNVLRALANEGFSAAIAASELQVDQETRNRLSGGFSSFLWPELTTPRMVKRLVNAIQFRLTLTGKEINVADFILLEGLREVAPAIHERLVTSRTLLLGGEEGAIFPEEGDTREAHQARLDQLLDLVQGDRRDRVKKLLELLFPHVHAVFHNHSSPDHPQEGWLEARRVCTHEYFVRHFAAGVLSNDIADSSVSLLASLLSSGDAEGARQWLDDVGGRADAPYLLEKLRRFLADSTGGAAHQAAVGLARLGHRFSADAIGILFPPRAVAAGMVGELLRRIDDREARAEAGLATVSEPVELDVAVRVFDTVAIYEDKNRPRATFTKEEQDRLLGRVVQRLEGAASELASIGGQHLARVLWAWGRIGALQGATGWFERSYEKDGTILDRVLLGFAAGESWEVETGRARPNLSREAFEQLTSAIRAAAIEEGIQERFPGVLTISAEDELNAVRLEPAAFVAWQFHHLYRRLAGSHGNDTAVQPEGS